MVEGSRVRNTIHGREIVRRCRVFDLPVQALGTAWAALLNIIKDPQCPPLNVLHPDPTTQAFLEEHVLVSIEKPKRYVDVDLIYRAAPVDSGGQDVIAWTVTDQHVTQHVLTNRTAGGVDNLNVWYKLNTSPQIDVKPAGSITKGVETHKMIPERVIRVTGRATKQQWTALRPKIRAARGRINKDNWGGYNRGVWLFFGPNTHTIDRGNSYDVSLEFGERELGWYPINVYRDENGNIPDDIATEKILRTGGLPPEGSKLRRNGIAISSVYEEVAFASIFNFTPDNAPTPS